MPTLNSTDLREQECRFNDNYVCHINQVDVGPSTICIHFHVKGDGSLGATQYPTSSLVGVYNDGQLEKTVGVSNSLATSDPSDSEYAGILQFSINDNFRQEGTVIGFQYAQWENAVIPLFVATR